METEKILSQIKARVGQTDVSDQSISDYIKLHLSDDAEPDEAFYDKAVKLIKSFQGNISNFAATTVKKQIEAKMSELKNSQPQQADPKSENPKEGDAELLKRLEALEQAYEKERKLNMVNSLRNEVKSKADALKVARKSLWEDIVSTIDIPEDATAESLLETVKPTYEAKLRSYLGDGAVPYQGNPNPPKNDGGKLDEFFAKKLGQANVPKKE